ncbi:MAG: hypothetical protein HN478_22720 [Rhodospirillaceae bacterium]|jgi:signal transduction histidine kinase|nr:hypothetical protein [Rhodospirillaceae bacterium]
MDRRHARLEYARHAWLGRTIGLCFAVLSFGSVLYQRDASMVQWLLLLSWGFIWPQVAYLIASRAENPFRADQRNLLFDAFLGGAWMSIVAFNVVPSFVVNALIFLSILGTRGPWRLINAAAVMVLGAAAGSVTFGFDYQPLSTMDNIIWTMPVLVGFLAVYGMVTNDQNRKLALRTRELAEEVSRRTEAQRAARQAQGEAEAANRTKTEFLSQMSHELRTPLNAVIGFSEAMAAGVGGKLSDRHAEYVDDISGSGQHLLSLINDILDLSKVESGNAEIYEEEVDVRDVVEHALPFVRNQAHEAGIVLATDLPSRIPPLRADPLKLKQMLVNLLSNAVKFTPSDGRVTVHVEESKDLGLIISVADTGTGMRPEDIPRALSPYVQVHDGGKIAGTGLGLPLVKAMAELHGGGLEVESELGVGTTAAITFPPDRIVA